MKARDLKAVLRVIDDFGIVCFASHRTIAKAIARPVAHTRRCLRALQQLGLLVSMSRSGGIEYRIVFSEIAAANQRKNA